MKGHSVSLVSPEWSHAQLLLQHHQAAAGLPVDSLAPWCGCFAQLHAAMVFFVPHEKYHVYPEFTWLYMTAKEIFLWLNSSKYHTAVDFMEVGMSYLHVCSGIPTTYASGGHCPVLSSAWVHTHSPPHPLRGLRTLVLWWTAWPQHQAAQWEREAVALQFHHPG